MAELQLNHAKAREWLRRRLKDGYIWSRFSPDLLKGDELLPYMDLNNPPQSPATLVPFPIAARRYKDFDPDASDYLQKLAQEKIRWCNGSHKAGLAVVRRIIQQLNFYNHAPSPVGHYYYWLEPDPRTSPFWPLARMIFPALDRYSLAQPILPEPPLHRPGEAWQSASDQYGVGLRFSSVLENEDSLILAAALLGKKTYWLRNYRLNPDRYAFIRQQLFYLLGERLEPWLPGELPKQSSYRGMVYRRPKQK